MAILLATGATAQASKSITLQAAPAPTGVFQSLEFATNATAGLSGWKSAQAKMAREAGLYAACDSDGPDCPEHLHAWRSKLKSWSALSARAKLIHVNRFVNAAVTYVDDRKAFRKADYWASPAESLKGRGDCEDYALLKYASLRALGFRENQLRIVVVNDLAKGIGHAVLSVKTADGTYILDNQDSRVLRHDTIARYAPVYSVNAAGRWINIATKDLKAHKAAPAALVASAEELGESIPAAAAPSAKPAAAVQAEVVPPPLLEMDRTPSRTDMRAGVFAVAGKATAPALIAVQETDPAPTRWSAVKLSGLWQPVSWLLSRLAA